MKIFRYIINEGVLSGYKISILINLSPERLSMHRINRSWQLLISNPVLLILCLLSYRSICQFTWTKPYFTEHGIIDFATINNPTSSGQTLVTSISRTFGVEPTYSNILASVIVGISSMEFIPKASLNYRVQYTVAVGQVNIQLTLVYPTAFTKLSLSYFATRGSYASVTPYDYLTYLNAYSPITSSTQVLPASFSTTTGTRQARIANSPSGNIIARHFQKCQSNILGFIGTSSTQYQFGVSCQYQQSNYFSQKVTFYGDTLGTKIYTDIIVWNKYQTEIKNSIKFVYSSLVLFESGVTSQIIPNSIPSTDSAFFIGINYMTLRYNELYSYDYRFATTFVTVPTTRKNIFGIHLMSTKTCTNPLQVLNKANYLCVTNLLLPCTPEYAQFNESPSTVSRMYNAKMSSSKDIIAICWFDKVIIYKFNGMNYIKVQTLFMSTDCRDVETTRDFSILAIVGLNLFQIYTFDPDANEFINFYKFQSTLGMSYANRQISITEDGLKVVIASDISAGGQTYSGHYYFIFNQTINEYIYKRFDASGAINVYFGHNGDLMYVTTSSRIIVYKEKTADILGNFIISYVIDAMAGYTYTLCGQTALSGDEQVMATYVGFYGIKIYHYDNATNKFIQHSMITNIYAGQAGWVRLDLNYNGLVLVLGVDYQSALFYYTRASLFDDFELKTVLGDGSVQGLARSRFVSVSQDGKQVSLPRNGSILRIYYCATDIISSIPSNGKQLIMNASEQFTQFVSNMSNSSTQQLSSQLSNISQNLTNQLTSENSLLRDKIDVLEGKLNATEDVINDRLRDSMEQMNKLDQKLEKSQKDAMIVLIAVIGVVVVAIGVIVGVVKKTMAHRQVAPDVELKEDKVNLTFEQTIGKAQKHSSSLNQFSQSLPSQSILNSSQTTLINQSSLIKEQPSLISQQFKIEVQNLNSSQKPSFQEQNLTQFKRPKRQRNINLNKLTDQLEIVDVLELEIK